MQAMEKLGYSRGSADKIAGRAFNDAPTKRVARAGYEAVRQYQSGYAAGYSQTSTMVGAHGVDEVVGAHGVDEVVGAHGVEVVDERGIPIDLTGWSFEGVVSSVEKGASYAQRGSKAVQQTASAAKAISSTLKGKSPDASADQLAAMSVPMAPAPAPAQPVIAPQPRLALMTLTPQAMQLRSKTWWQRNWYYVAGGVGGAVLLGIVAYFAMRKPAPAGAR